MRILFVSNSIDGSPSSFVESQGKSLQALGVKVEYFLITRKGLLGYLRAFPELKQKIKDFKPQLIHAHYGLCGLLANMQRRLPVATTYHGSDINEKQIRLLSKISMLFSAFNIFVSKKQVDLASPKHHFTVQPCGINTNIFYPMDKFEARKIMKLDTDQKIILFSNFFSTGAKNAPLAIDAVSRIENAQILELKGYSAEQVCLLMNASDVALMTSISEGSPLFIKEAMACNRPIVSTDVGDVKELIDGLQGCSLCSYNPDDIADKIRKAFEFDKIENARERVIQFDENNVAKKIKSIYELILKSRKNG
jgi:teichuronic acid biosynthesis glycosyltransferase TuaC